MEWLGNAITAAATLTAVWLGLRTQDKYRQRDHNLEDRKALYVEFLTYMNPRLMVAASVRAGRPLPEDREMPAITYTDNLNYMTRISLLAPAEVWDKASVLLETVNRYLQVAHAPEHVHLAQKRDQPGKDVYDLWQDTIDSMKKDIGI